MIGYKVFDKNWKCKDYQYSCPGEFVMNEKPEICKIGFHFSPTMEDALSYKEFNYGCHIAKVEAIGDIVADSDADGDNENEITKYATNHLIVLEEVNFFDEWKKSLITDKVINFNDYEVRDIFHIGKKRFMVMDKTENYIDIQPMNALFAANMLNKNGGYCNSYEDTAVYHYLQENKDNMLPSEYELIDVFIPSGEYISRFNWLDRERWMPMLQNNGDDYSTRWWLSTLSSVTSSDSFATVSDLGLADAYSASSSLGVVPIFRIKL